MDLRKSTKERLQRVVRAFSLKDFLKYVLPEFKEVKQDDIARALEKNRYQLTKKSVNITFLKLLNAKHIDNETCENRIVLLQTRARILKPESCKWTALQMIGDPEIDHYTPSHVKTSVFRSLRRNGIESITRVILHASAFWINVTIKKVSRTKGLLLHRPIYCVFYVGCPFLFISKSIQAPVELPLVEALGFVEFRESRLTGYDPKSMLHILSTKGTRPEVVDSQEMETQPKETETGFDFSQSESRKKYIYKVFPQDFLKLSYYSVECKETPWIPESSFPEMANCRYPMSLHFQTKDCIGMFRALIEERAMEVPLPQYLMEALNCARNKMKINSNHNVTLHSNS